MKPAHLDKLPANVPRPGEIIAEKYRVERLLGAGGMGVVLAASHLGLGQSVAIKLMLPDLAASAELSARFLREARAAAAITGEHAVRIFDVDTAEDGTLYIVMELLDGEDLGQIIKQRGALPIAEAVDYILQACDALGDAHAQGIVHRDLKPGNLFVARHRKGPPILKVLDFGISKSTALDGAQSASTLTAPDSMLGTPYYMSPEQFRSAKSVDARTDIWSLGLILHKLITGFAAFESDSVREHISMIAADPPAPLRLRRPDAPAGLEAIVLRCLEKDASLRFQSVGQLVTALAPFASARPGIDLVVMPPSPAAVPPRLPPSAGPSETAPASGAQITGAQEISTATDSTSSLPRASLAPRPAGRRLLVGVLVATALLSGGALAFRGGKRGVATTPTVLAPSSPADPTAAPLSTAQPELTAPIVAAVQTPPSASGPIPAALNKRPPAAPSASAPVVKAGAPPARRNPPLPRPAPGVTPTPRPSLTTFQPSDL